MYTTKLDKFQLRYGEEKDVPIILGFIRELAIYENLIDKVTVNEEILQDSLFKRKVAEVIIGEYEGEAVGYALFFYNFSTFLGRPGIYLEDLYVKPEMRGKGLGKIIFSFLAKLVIERDCARLEWSCLNWNEPSIKFYKSLGAVVLDEWSTYRLTGDTLKNVSDNFIYRI
jgi:GNAT superfamily N-acetyltransferase